MCPFACTVQVDVAEPGECKDERKEQCKTWSAGGECTRNKPFMVSEQKWGAGCGAAPILFVKSHIFSQLASNRGSALVTTRLSQSHLLLVES